MDEIFVNVNDLAFYSVDADGTDHINVAAANVGDGARALKIDQSGLWLGAEKWADAPFRVDMAGNATMSSISLSGYVEDTGGQYVSAASGARVLLYPSSSIGFQAVDASSNNVFLLYVGGSNVGDVVIGDYSGGTGILWDNSAGDLIIKGDMTAGNISGVTITGSDISTGTTGTRVSMSANGDTISIYDSGNDLGMQLSLSGSDWAVITTDDARGLFFDVDWANSVMVFWDNGYSFDDASWDGTYIYLIPSGANAGALGLVSYGSMSFGVTNGSLNVNVSDSSGNIGFTSAGGLVFQSNGNNAEIAVDSSYNLYLNTVLVKHGGYDWFAVQSSNPSAPSPNSSWSSLYAYTDGGGNYYWRSHNNGTVYQFDQHTP